MKAHPVFLCVDDTMVSKFGKKFENVSKLFDHAAHNGSNYLNGHCFVSIMLCIPVLDHDKISYLSVPLGYRMWQKKESKLELAASMIRQVMPEFHSKEHVIFGDQEVLAYVTDTEKGNGTKRLFFSTIFPEDLKVFYTKEKHSSSDQTDHDPVNYIPLLLYAFRWKIEISYYEQKTFWSFCEYMVRSRKGIEMLVNLINISYCAMKILPYQDKYFSKYRTKSVQEFRFELSQEIRKQIFFVTFVENIETHIKSKAMIKALKQLIYQQVCHS